MNINEVYAGNSEYLKAADIKGKGDEIPEPLLNRVEHGIRCYDPCLSCSTHAVGQMPLHVRLIGTDGKVWHEVTRG